MHSYWEKKYWFDQYDVAIIGGGIVGLTTAYYLQKKDPGLRIAVIDRYAVPTGASTRNAGFACFGTAGEMLDDLKTMDEEKLMELVVMRWKGLHRLLGIHPAHTIDYRQRGGHEVFAEENSFRNCEEQLDRINRIMENATGENEILKISKQESFPKLYKQSIYNRFEGELNPVKLIRSLMDQLIQSGIALHFGFNITRVEEGDRGFLIQTEKGLDIEAQKLVYCTNAFSGQFLNEDIIPARNQVLVSEEIPGLDIKGVYHFDRGYIYFRSIGNRLLIGGARNLDPQKEQTEKFGPNKKIIRELKSFSEKMIMGKPIKYEYCWSGIIASGSSRFPILQKKANNSVMAVRLGGMGIAIGSELAFRASEMILE